MKHFLLGVLAAIITVGAACLALEYKYGKTIEPTVVSTDVQQPVIDLEFQEFNSVTEITEFHQVFQEKYENERLFVSLPSHTITNISSFLVSEKIPITIENIVNEYKRNAQIYDNIIAANGSEPNIESKDSIPRELTIVADDTIKLNNFKE